VALHVVSGRPTAETPLKVTSVPGPGGVMVIGARRKLLKVIVRVALMLPPGNAL
jgi:hypothetical protein